MAEHIADFPANRPRWWLGPFTRSTLRDSCFLVLSLPVGLLWTSLMFYGLIAAVVLLVPLLGASFLVLFRLARTGARLERSRMRRLTRLVVGSPAYRSTPDAGLIRRMKDQLTDGAQWRTVSYLLLTLPLGLVSFLVAMLIWVETCYGLSYPLWAWRSDLSTAWGGPNPLSAIALHFAAGVAAFLLGPVLIRAMVGLHVRFADRLIGS